jgi:hypothetical protein
MQSPLAVAEERGEGPIVPVRINPVDPLPVEPTDARTEALPKHGEGRKIQLYIPMGVGIVLVRIEIGLMIEQAVQDVRGIALRALNRYGIEGGVVVRNEGIEL